jgi:glutamate 5-kinase
MTANERQIPELVKSCRRIVVKIGSALVTEKGRIKEKWLEALAEDIAAMANDGHEIVIVTSGAIALGRKFLGLDNKTNRTAIALDLEQAAAAAGQIHLITAYYKAFEKAGIEVAQVLLSPHDTEGRRPHLNARATINALLSRKIIPVINENDSVATEEIRFGDNDRLAARVGQMIEADLVMLLSTTDGFYTADPGIDPKARHIPYIDKLDKSIFEMAGDAPAGVSTGGMRSKVEAARLATNAGTALLIADGRKEHSLSVLLSDLSVKSTWFKPKGNPGSARKRWIESHIRTEGVLVIDEGAATALLSGKSLLPIGVTKIEGDFERGDAVTIRNKSGEDIAIGLIAFSSTEAKRIAGLKSSELETVLGYSGRSEMIHRNDMALI